LFERCIAFISTVHYLNALFLLFLLRIYIYICIHIHTYVCVCEGGGSSSVCIATELRAGRSGIESQWGRDLWPVQTDPGAHPASYTMGAGPFPGVKCGRGVLLTTHLLLCRVHGRVELYLYPPSGAHRACNGIALPFYLIYI